MKTFRYQRIYILSLLALGICAGAAGTGVLARWQAERAIGADARVVLEHGARQVEQTLQGWKKSVTLFRETLDKAPGISAAERVALAGSVAEQTPALVGMGWMDRHGAFHWLTAEPVGGPALAAIVGRVREKAWLHNLFSVPSAWAVPFTSERPVLVLVEPLRAPSNRPDRIVAIFEIRPTLEGALGRRPMRLIGGEGRVLYQSADWKTAPSAPLKQPVRNGSGQLSGSNEKSAPRIEERPVRFSGLRWTLQTQRRTGSGFPYVWFVALMAASAVATALAAGGIYWAGEHLRRLATTDELTGLPNRRDFLERWSQEFERARRYNRPLACLMVDVNGFKRVNDLLGHSAGDRILRRVAQEVKRRLRQSDLVARYGGDEFVVALPETDLERARAVAQKLRQISINGTFLRPVRLSVGVGDRKNGESAEAILQKADEDLYASRRAGNGWGPTRPSTAVLATGTYGTGSQRGHQP